MSLLHHRHMSLQQIRTLVRDDFEIHDQSGAAIGLVHTQGALMKRLALGNRSLRVTELDGRELFTVTDVINVGFDEMVIETPKIHLATFRRMFAIKRMRASITMVDGRRLVMEGKMFSFTFTVMDGDEVVATVSRRWPSASAALLGKERYTITFETDAEKLRAAILGGILCMDMMLAKARHGSIIPNV